MLDVTSNFDVASFFATCAWNPGLRKYEPVTDNFATGVIYRITPALMCSMERPDEPFGPVHIVGWQPLPRPEQQRAFVVKMNPGQDFTSLPTVELFPFQHQADISYQIWNAFEQGEALFPSDAGAELARRAESLSEFTESQIKRAWQRLEQWNRTTYEMQVREPIMSDIGITKIAAPTLNWDGLGVECSEDILMQHLVEILERVRCRMAACG